MLLTSLYNDKIEAGCDEAGRGCLAGPVVAAAVILPKTFSCSSLDDSKKLTSRQRYALLDIIKGEALAWAITEVSASVIDEINILQASFRAMSMAVEALSVKPDIMLIDGNRFSTHLDIPFECIVGGDGKIASIAAASILAKTYRDDLMKEFDVAYPGYGWGRNMGYPTKEHRAAIAELGPTCLHRTSFRWR